MHASANRPCGSRRRAGTGGAAGTAARGPGVAAGFGETPLHTPAIPRLARGRLPRLGTFLGGRRGGVPVETALAITVLVVFVLSPLMAIASATYSDDRMGRAARGAARAVALETDLPATQASLDAKACTAIRTELDLADGFDCNAKWAVKVSADLKPSSLESGTNSGEAGDMVLVEIEWKRVPWTRIESAFAGDDPIATGVARREPVDPAAGP